MFLIIYGVIILTATFLGAFVGLGGGVIIKPLLDLIGHDTVDAVNFISSCAVFSMSISSTVRHIKSKTKIDCKLTAGLSSGAVIGGIFGARVFDFLLDNFASDKLKNIQGVILGILLITSVVYINLKNAKTFHLKSIPAICVVGFAMGTIASFLGVGGGPINVAFLVLFFSMTVKEAAVYSVEIIFFSQLSKLITVFTVSGVPNVSALTVAVAVVCAAAGGILGAKANKKGNEKTVRKIFTAVVTAVALVNFYNGIV